MPIVPAMNHTERWCVINILKAILAVLVAEREGMRGEQQDRADKEDREGERERERQAEIRRKKRAELARRQHLQATAGQRAFAALCIESIELKRKAAKEKAEQPRPKQATLEHFWKKESCPCVPTPLPSANASGSTSTGWTEVIDLTQQS